jgi:hypothetical protein
VIQELGYSLSGLQEAHHVSSASLDEITQQWLPLISISWMKDNGRLEVHFNK